MKEDHVRIVPHAEEEDSFHLVYLEHNPFSSEKPHTVYSITCKKPAIKQYIRNMSSVILADGSADRFKEIQINFPGYPDMLNVIRNDTMDKMIGILLDQISMYLDGHMTWPKTFALKGIYA